MNLELDPDLQLIPHNEAKVRHRWDWRPEMEWTLKLKVKILQAKYGSLAGSGVDAPHMS